MRGLCKENVIIDGVSSHKAKGSQRWVLQLSLGNSSAILWTEFFVMNSLAVPLLIGTPFLRATVALVDIGMQQLILRSEAVTLPLLGDNTESHAETVLHATTKGTTLESFIHQ